MTFKEILELYRVPFAEGGNHKNVRSGFIGVECFQCSSGEGKYHAGYSVSGNYVFCWKCGKLPLIKVLMELTGQTYATIKDLIGDLRREQIPQFDKPKGILKLPTGLSPLSKIHKDYLRSRGFTNISELESLWKLQGIGLHSRLPWRIFIPVQQRFKTVTYTTRSLVDEGIRYVNAKPEDEAVPIKSTLFGADYVGHAAILVEGCFDVMKIGPGAVCGFGMSLSAEQFRQFSRYPVRIICLDNESDAQKRAEKLGNELSGLPGKTFNVTLNSKDAGEASEKDLEDLRRML